MSEIEDVEKKSKLDDLYDYFKNNVISSILAIINLIGIFFFLIYFTHIDYLPDLDFTGVMYLLVAVAIIGLFFLIYFAMTLILPGEIWKAHFKPEDRSQKHFTWTYFIFSVLYLVSLYMMNYQSFNTKDVLDLSNLIFGAGFILYILTFIFAPIIYSKYVLSQSLNSSENSDNFFAFYFQSFITFTIISLSFFTLKENALIVKSLYVIIISFVYFLINFLVLKIKQTKIVIMISPLLVIFLLMSIGQLHSISSVTLRLLHMGNFPATIILNKDFCNVQEVISSNKKDLETNACIINANVIWRIGKETLLEIKGKRFTVPSNQIISMIWEPIKVLDINNTSSYIISFEFNSTRLTRNGKKELIKQIEILDKNTTEITVYGCSSPEGTEKFNKILSKQRAEKIQTWLDGYFAHETKQIKINIIAEGTSKHCTDKNLIEELAKHRKVIIE